jgi:exoribonuclease-2
MTLGIKRFSSSKSSNKIKPGSFVDYELHGNSILAVATYEHRGKWSLINERGEGIDLPSNRLFLLPRTLPERQLKKTEIVPALEILKRESNEISQNFDIESVWDQLKETNKDFTAADFSQVAFGDEDAPHLVAARRALLADKVYFKRNKNTFGARSLENVNELKSQAAALAKKEHERKILFDAILARLSDIDAPLPNNIHELEQVAAMGRKADSNKLISQLLDDVETKTQRQLGGKLEHRAFELLVRLAHFSPIENLRPIRLGRPTGFTEEEINEARKIDLAEALSEHKRRRDLTHVFTFTVDGEDTQDFDDSISLERLPDGYLVGIHISDVASLIEIGSKLDDAAMRRGTSIYCPDQTYPMLPIPASEGSLSLLVGEKRPTIRYLIEFDESFEIIHRSVERTVTSVDSRLTYNQVDSMLFPPDDPNSSVEESLLSLWRITSEREIYRQERGAIQFDRREMIPVVSDSTRVTLVQTDEDTPARRLVSELMILANETAALFARDNNIPLYFRTQEKPEAGYLERVDQVPEGPAQEYAKRGALKRSIISSTAGGHAALALDAYAQTTSPIRRILDLINQRQISSFLLEGNPLYNGAELEALQERFETGLAEAAQIQRARTRFWLLRYLEQENITSLTGTIVRVDGPKPMAEVDKLFSLFPFHPVNHFDINKEESLPSLGKPVTLRIEKLNSRTESIVLKEVED